MIDAINSLRDIYTIWHNSLCALSIHQKKDEINKRFFSSTRSPCFSIRPIIHFRNRLIIVSPQIRLKLFRFHLHPQDLLRSPLLLSHYRGHYPLLLQDLQI